MEKLILMPRFVDRGGRTVYDIHKDDPKKRVCSPGEFIGQIRLAFNEATEISLELLAKHEPTKGGGTG